MMLSCKDASRLVSDSLDRKLPWRQRLQLRIHLLICSVCARFRRQVLFLDQTASRYFDEGKVEVNDNETRLDDDARERIKHALRSQRP